MTSTIFFDWFHKSFVPQVTEFLSKQNLPVKALLLIDNTPSHPSELELKNVTPLIQLMDQNAIKNSEVVDSMKTVTLKDAVTLLEIAWNRVSKDTMAKCWKNILSFTEDEEDPEENIPLSILKENMDSELQQQMARTVDVLSELSPQVDYTVSSIQEWNEDILLDNVTGSCENEELEVTDDDDYDVDKDVQRIKPSEAIEIFNRALDWAGCENVEQSDLNVLRRLREKAVFQLLERKKQQKNITDFFKDM